MIWEQKTNRSFIRYQLQLFNEKGVSGVLTSLVFQCGTWAVVRGKGVTVESGWEMAGDAPPPETQSSLSGALFSPVLVSSAVLCECVCVCVCCHLLPTRQSVPVHGTLVGHSCTTPVVLHHNHHSPHTFHWRNTQSCAHRRTGSTVDSASFPLSDFARIQIASQKVASLPFANSKLLCILKTTKCKKIDFFTTILQLNGLIGVTVVLGE